MAIGSLKISAELVLAIVNSVKATKPYVIEVIKNPVPADAEVVNVTHDSCNNIVIDLKSDSIQENGPLPTPWLQQTFVKPWEPPDGSFVLCPEAYSILKQIMLRRGSGGIVLPDKFDGLVEKLADTIWEKQGVCFKQWT